MEVEYPMGPYDSESGIRFFLYGEITGPENYLLLIYTLMEAEEEDNIYLHINTPGGDLSSTVAIINAINNSKANVIGVADAEVVSAGSLIFFSCSELEVNPHCTFMFHCVHSGESNSIKVSDKMESARFDNKHTEELYQEVYRDILTNKEISDVLKGHDVWLTSSEVLQRLS